MWPWPWPMTLKFSRVLEVVEVHVYAKFHQAERNGSWVIMLPQKKNSDENNTVCRYPELRRREKRTKNNKEKEEVVEQKKQKTWETCRLWWWCSRADLVRVQVMTVQVGVQWAWWDRTFIKFHIHNLIMRWEISQHLSVDATLRKQLVEKL